MRRLVLLWLFYVYLTLMCITQCSSQVCQGATCSECISRSTDCKWCKQPKFSEIPLQRCDTEANLMDFGCKEEHIVKSTGAIVDAQNESLTDGDVQTNKKAVQLQPQGIHIKATPNFPIRIPISFRAARNYPVDLYFLFDVSATMKTHRENLGRLATKMASEIKSISTNYRFGFGCFQDKVVLPFTDTFKKKLQDGLSDPFGFKHKLSLTNNIEDFVDTVISSPSTGNIDQPEGGLDAIMQVMACDDDIGWREEARRLIIYSSDSTFHIAGDAKLAGIYYPNDGQCHLLNGSNIEELNQDYPSIGQISQKAGVKNVNIIFAILKNVEEQYKKLSDNVLNSFVGVLEGDSSNIIDIVRKNYEAVISEVKFKINAPNDTIVKIFSDCNNGIMTETTECGGLSIGKEIKLMVEVYATSCPKDKSDWNKVINITTVGLLDKLSINLQLDCECDCQKPEFQEVSSSKCNNKGTFECGICDCDAGREGTQCQCSEFDVLEGKNITACVKPNTTVTCLGRGECKCGVCDCKTGYSGRFCECETSACGSVDGQVCGGPERGRCVCETCICNEGYTGDKCNCPISTVDCQTSDGLICNGKGECKCGKCTCESGYVGRKCESCPTCPGACVDNRECVECVVFAQGPLSGDQCKEKCPHIEILDTLDKDNHTCEVKDFDGCTMVYSIESHEDGNITVKAQRVKVCGADVDAVPIIAGVMGGIVGIGIFLLALWKILTSVYDGIEYSKFEQEINQIKFAKESNPIYKGATSTYKNPMCDDFE